MSWIKQYEDMLERLRGDLNPPKGWSRAADGSYVLEIEGLPSEEWPRLGIQVKKQWGMFSSSPSGFQITVDGMTFRYKNHPGLPKPRSRKWNPIGKEKYEKLLKRVQESLESAASAMSAHVPVYIAWRNKLSKELDAKEEFFATAPPTPSNVHAFWGPGEQVSLRITGISPRVAKQIMSVIQDYLPQTPEK